MTITCKDNNDIIVYALEKITSHARKTLQIFVAQCVWWLESIIGLEQGLINYIDNTQSRVEVTVTSDVSPSTVDKTIEKPEKVPQDKVLQECEEF
jgi:hypothetical protein